MASSTQDIGGLTGWIFDVVDALGAFGLAVLNVIDTFFPPIPSEVFLPVGGYLASQGELSLVAAWIGATVGSLIGAVALYAVGAGLGRDRVDAALGHIPLVRADDLDRADDWFERHGTASVLLGRLVPGVRSLVSLPAGVSGMGLGTFCALTTVGSGVWNGLLLWAGWALGSQWGRVEEFSSWLDVALIVAAVAAVAHFVWKRRDRITGDDEDARADDHDTVSSGQG